MRILMLVHNRAGFGTFARAFSLGRHLVTGGHDVTLYCSARRAAAGSLRVVEGVRVIESCDPLPARVRDAGLSPLDVLGRVARLRGERFDIVHAFDHRPAVALPALWAARGAALIIDWADLWGFEGIAAVRGRLSRHTLGRCDDVMERWFRTRAQGLTVINTALRTRVERHFPRTPCLLLPVGSNSDRMSAPPKLAARRALGVPPDAAVVVHAGLAPYDLEFLAQSLIELSTMRSNLAVLLAGRRIEDLEARLAARGASVRVIQLGPVPPEALPEVLGCADVLLLPYRDTGVNRFRFPNKLGDYLAAGRPIVTNPTGDLGELSRRLGCAVLADETPAAFARAVADLLDDPPRAEQLGARGRAVSETELSWARFAQDLAGFYRQVLDGRSAPRAKE